MNTSKIIITNKLRSVHNREHYIFAFENFVGGKANM